MRADKRQGALITGATGHPGTGPADGTAVRGNGDAVTRDDRHGDARMPGGPEFGGPDSRAVTRDDRHGDARMPGGPEFGGPDSGEVTRDDPHGHAVTHGDAKQRAETRDDPNGQTVTHGGPGSGAGTFGGPDGSAATRDGPVCNRCFMRFRSAPPPGLRAGAPRSGRHRDGPFGHRSDHHRSDHNCSDPHRSDPHRSGDHRSDRALPGPRRTRSAPRRARNREADGIELLRCPDCGRRFWADPDGRGGRCAVGLLPESDACGPPAIPARRVRR